MTDFKTNAAVSIVVPFHNEQDNVPELYARLRTVMERVAPNYEFVFVDDGSTDLTFKLLRELATIDARVTVVRLRRNFGQTGALAAGFAQSTGEYVIAMDGDLQHDPDEIPVFLEKLEQGYDIVSGWRKHRVDNLWLRKIPSRCANWIMAKLSGVNIHDFGTTFKAYRGDLLRQLPLYGELHRFIPAIASAYGVSICEVPIQNSQRKHGVSHYNISRTFRVLFDLITIRFLLRYMSRPLHFFGRLGLFNMLAGSAIAVVLSMWKLSSGGSILKQHGLLMALSTLLSLGGLQLIAVGLLGELSVWQHFKPSAPKAYSISQVLQSRFSEGAPAAESIHVE